MCGKKIIWLLLILTSGCVELYDFRIKNENPSLVIEGEISDLSYNEYKEIPADGRYFSVRLSQTNNVSNVRNKPVGNADVRLVDSEGSTWSYEASEVNPGYYFLMDRDFQAAAGIQYRLIVILPEGSRYESAWEQMPETEPQPMGDIHFEEVVRQQYEYRNRERLFVNVRGADVKIDLPVLRENGTVFYKWDFDATWIYRATLVSSLSPVYRCWITNPYYLSDYVLQKDNIGGYPQDLFFLRVDGNDRIFDKISFLIRQYAMSEAYYNYWMEIRQQDERKGLFDPPPFNLISNLHAQDPEREVFGYFGVVREQGKRWYFSRLDLEVPVENTWSEFCRNPDAIPPPKCSSCLEYGEGIAVNEQPWWWEE